VAVVFDTNVLISAALQSASVPSLAVRHAVRNDLILASAATISELAVTLERPKFDRYLSHETRREFVVFVHMSSVIVDIRRSIRACRDAEDDKFLEVAVNGRAELIVTGDADLLALHPFEGIAIVTAAGYLGRVGR
jgi:putative PIN family toxin of toxin-antitoxin system